MFKGLDCQVDDVFISSPHTLAGTTGERSNDIIVLRAPVRFASRPTKPAPPSSPPCRPCRVPARGGGVAAAAGGLPPAARHAGSEVHLQHAKSLATRKHHDRLVGRSVDQQDGLRQKHCTCRALGPCHNPWVIVDAQLPPTRRVCTACTAPPQDWLSDVTFALAPIQLHALALATFASFIAPFGERGLGEGMEGGALATTFLGT